MRYFFLLVLCGYVFFTACSDSDTSTNPTIGGYILPAAVGNYWIYQTTITTTDTTYARQDTLRVAGTETRNGSLWYDFRYGTNTNATFLFRNIESGLKIYANNTESLLYPYPAAKDATSQANIGNGWVAVKVTSINESVTTPVGTFKCYCYSYNEGSDKTYKDYMAQGVGYIRRVYQRSTNNGGTVSTYTETMDLVSTNVRY